MRYQAALRPDRQDANYPTSPRVDTAQVGEVAFTEQAEQMMSLARLSAVTLGLFVLTCPLYAQQAQPFEPLFLPTVQFGAPLKMAGGLAVFLPTKEEPGFRRSGFIVEGSVGQGGARASFGPAGILESVMMDARFVLHRTWNSPRKASADSTYGGAEAGLTIAYVRVSAGVARRLGGSGADATIFTWTAGLHYPFAF